MDLREHDMPNRCAWWGAEEEVIRRERDGYEESKWLRRVQALTDASIPNDIGVWVEVRWRVGGWQRDWLTIRCLSSDEKRATFFRK